MSLELVPYDKSFRFDLPKIPSSIRPNSRHTAHIIYDAKSNDGKNVNDTVIVKLELSNGLTYSQKYVVMATINSVEDEIEQKTQVSNNPSSLEQVIYLPENFDLVNANYNLINLNGEILYSSDVRNNMIDLSEIKLKLDAGTYFVNVKNSNHSINKKIIVIK